MVNKEKVNESCAMEGDPVVNKEKFDKSLVPWWETLW